MNWFTKAPSFVLFALFVQAVSAGPRIKMVEHSDEQNTTAVAPIVATPSEHWEGVDGTWSTFEIRVGTPATTYRVLPVTSWQETWVIYGAAAGVCNTSLGVPSDCIESRGGAFDMSESSTWESRLQYTLGLDQGLGYDGVGQYGLDTVGLGYTNATGPTLSNQVVAEIVSDSWWFGILGIGFQPTNFSGYANGTPSFASTLYTNKQIESTSWSYTAGAYYQLKSVFGQLIFGGKDNSRYVENDVVFSMTGDNLRDIVVAIQGITSSITSGNTTLMDTAELAFIDSSVPELWLPLSVCQAFETAFGITYDSTSELYLLNASTHNSLLKQNPNITVTLANQKSGGPTTDIVLPYSAFDLNISAPLLPNSTGQYYFPIRRQEDDTQYVLGRTFLQEAYVTTHYESRTFNVSQAIFQDPATPNIVAIPTSLPSSGTNPTTTGGNGGGTGAGSGHHGSKKLAGGAIAGIVIGAVVALALLALLVVFLLRRRRRARRSKAGGKEQNEDSAVEIDSGKRVGGPTAYGQQASGFTNEVEGKDAKVEKFGNPIMIPQELEGDVPPSRRRGNGPTPMAEIGEDEGGLGGYGAEPGQRKTPMAELGERERGLGSSQGVSEEEGDVVEELVSPNSDGRGAMDSVLSRGRPVSSAISSEGTGNWSPQSANGSGIGQRGSKFEERL